MLEWRCVLWWRSVWAQRRNRPWGVGTEPEIWWGRGDFWISSCWLIYRFKAVIDQFSKFQPNLSISKNKRHFKYMYMHIPYRKIFTLLYWRISKILLSTQNTWEVYCTVKMVRCPCLPRMSTVYASCPNIISGNVQFCFSKYHNFNNNLHGHPKHI